MKFKDFHRNVKIRMGLSFLGGASNNLVLPFMSIYFSGKLGDAAAGLAVILGIIAGVVSGIVGGYYADRIGRKKLMLAGWWGWTLSYLGMALSNAPWFESPGITFALMIAIRIFAGIHGPANDAMLLDVTAPEARKYMYAIMYWIHNLSFAVSAIAGSFLFKSYLFELFIGLTAASLISLLVTYFFVDEVYKPQAKAENKKTEEASIWTNYKMVLKDSTFMTFTMASVLLFSVEFHLGSYVGVRLVKEMADVSFFDWGALSWRIDGFKMLGLLSTENTILVVVLSVIMSVIMKRFSDSKVLFTGYILYIVGYSYLAYSNQPWLLLLSMFIATVGELMYVPINQAFLGYIVPDHARSTYMAVKGMTNRGAMLLGGGGVILGGHLPSWMMASLIAISGFMGMALFYTILSRLDNGNQKAETLRRATV